MTSRSLDWPSPLYLRHPPTHPHIPSTPHPSYTVPTLSKTRPCRCFFHLPDRFVGGVVRPGTPEEGKDSTLNRTLRLSYSSDNSGNRISGPCHKTEGMVLRFDPLSRIPVPSLSERGRKRELTLAPTPPTTPTLVYWSKTLLILVRDSLRCQGGTPGPSVLPGPSTQEYPMFLTS